MPPRYPDARGQCLECLAPLDKGRPRATGKQPPDVVMGFCRPCGDDLYRAAEALRKQETAQANLFSSASKRS